MRGVLRGLKRLLFFKLGGFFVWRLLNRNRIVILTLHGVSGAEMNKAWQPLRPLYPAAQLERALRILGACYEFVSLADAVEMLAGRRKMVNNAMVLTFDDGYRNQFLYALPVMHALQVPGTFYVATQPVDRREPFWFDRLDYALQQCAPGRRTVRVNGADVEIDGTSRGALSRSYARLRARAKAMRCDDEMAAELEGIANALEAESGRRLKDLLGRDDWAGFPTWEEFRQWAREQYVELGSHTVTHTRLALVSAERALGELTVSKRRMEEAVGRPCAHFCYPSGSYNAATAKLAAQAGYVSAVTSQHGLNSVGDDLYQLKRIALLDFKTPSELLANASGFDDFVRAPLNKLKAVLGS